MKRLSLDRLPISIGRFPESWQWQMKISRLLKFSLLAGTAPVNGTSGQASSLPFTEKAFNFDNLPMDSGRVPASSFWFRSARGNSSVASSVRYPIESGRGVESSDNNSWSIFHVIILCSLLHVVLLMSQQSS